MGRSQCWIDLRKAVLAHIRPEHDAWLLRVGQASCLPAILFVSDRLEARPTFVALPRLRLGINHSY